MGSMSNTEILRLLGAADAETHKAVLEKIAECDVKLKAKMPNHKPIMPNIVYDLKGTTAGQAIGTHTIRLNLDLLLNPDTRDRMLNQTVPHEYTHIIQMDVWPRSKSHGWQWRMLMNYIGLPAFTTHDMPVTKARKTRRWAYTCENGCATWNLSTQRHNKLQRNPHAYVCPHCGGSLIYNG